jgi:ABC-type lipoprotein release transport system permease subunit
MSAVGLTAVLCLAGSMFPALRAARIAVPVALRDE